MLHACAEFLKTAEKFFAPVNTEILVEVALDEVSKKTVFLDIKVSNTLFYGKGTPKHDTDVAIYSVDEKYKYFITRYRNMLSTQRVCFVISVRCCVRIFYALYRNRAYIFCTVMNSSIHA